MIFLFGIVISVFLFVLLLFKKNKITADNILLLWLLIIAVHQVLSYAHVVQAYERYAFLIGLDMPLPLLHPPLLFLYVSALTGTLHRKKPLVFVHFIPALTCGVYLLFNFFLLPGKEKIFIMNHEGVGFETFVLFRYGAIIFAGVAYVSWSLYKIHVHQKRIKNVFSNIEKINLRWLQVLTYGIGIIWITVIVGTDAMTNTVAALFVLLIGFFGIRQTPVFTGVWLLPSAPLDVNDPPKKYESSGLSQEKKQLLETGLTKKINEEKIFLEPDLSLDKLASELNVHPNYLSQYINEILGLTFYDYINLKRIEEFKRLARLQQSKNFNLLGLSYDCGFNSKSSFNRNFKKLSGQTPSEYLADLNKIPSVQ